MLVESRWQWFNFNGHGGRGLIVIRNAHEQEAEVLAAIGLRASVSYTHLTLPTILRV